MATATPVKDSAVHTVIFNNDRYARVCGGMRITGPVRFAIFTDNSPKGKATPEIKGVWLTPGGPNHNLTGEQLEIIKASDEGKKLLAQGVLQIISPADLEGASGTTSDYDDVTALSIIRDSEDRAWLETSEKQEKRPAIREALNKQMAAIDSRLQALSKRAMANE